MMPFEDDREFEFFYDFSRQYRHLPQKTLALENATKEAEKSFNLAEERKIAKEQKLAASSSGKKDGDEEEDDWEDCDIESGDEEMIEEVDEDDDD